MKIGFVGLGIMGQPMALNLVKAGFEVIVWNRTPGKADRLTAEGATKADSLTQLAETAETILVIVNDTPDVEAVIFGESGLEKGLRSDQTIIDMTTINPDATEEFAARLKKMGCEMLDAPVSGGDIGAQKGTLTIMVGGEKTVFDTCLPIFETLGKNIVHCGGHGDGQRTKMINQIFCGLHAVALSEAFSLAEKMGLNLETVHQVVSSGAAGSWALDNYGPRVLKGDFEPGFKLGMQQKDLRIAAEISQKYGEHFKGTELAYELFTEAKKRGLSELGSHGLIKLYEQ